MDNTEKTFDPYQVVITLERSWGADVAISSRGGENYPANQPPELAVHSLVLDEILSAIKNEYLNGKVVSVKVKPPGFERDTDKFKMAREVISAFHDILTSTKVNDQELKDGTWDKLMAFLREHPEMLNTRKLWMANQYWEFPPDAWVELQVCVKEDKKIQAIKIVRTVTNAGLKEAKDAVEDYQHNKLFRPQP